MPPPAEIEAGVEIGGGTAVWAGRARRGRGARDRRDCIIGEQTYIGPTRVIGDLVKLNAMVYVCTGVTIDDGVMVGAGTIFTNDRYPRGTSPDLAALRALRPRRAHARRPASKRARASAPGATIGCGLTIGRWRMVGMGSVVTRATSSLPPRRRQPGALDRDRLPLRRAGVAIPAAPRPDRREAECPACGLRLPRRRPVESKSSNRPRRPGDSGLDVDEREPDRSRSSAAACSG